MMRFVAGLMLGLCMGGSAAVAAADVFKENGGLRGWSVINDGEDVCTSLFVWHRRREIDCG